MLNIYVQISSCSTSLEFHKGIVTVPDTSELQPWHKTLPAKLTRGCLQLESSTFSIISVDEDGTTSFILKCLKIWKKITLTNIYRVLNKEWTPSPDKFTPFQPFSQHFLKFIRRFFSVRWEYTVNVKDF